MQSSQSSNSQSKDVKNDATATPLWMDIIVWSLRIVVGAIFIVSGVSKSIDWWGTFYKIEEYLGVWGWDMPRSLILTGAALLSIVEGGLGVMLLLGCYRRMVVRLLALIMIVMLPLTVYIYTGNPVADCGCFGDFLVLSNGATLIKNVIITAALVPLLLYNNRVTALISPPLQWLGAVLTIIYLLAIGLYGYNIQPMVDFRRFPEGTEIATIATDDAIDEDVEFEFIYEKDGVKKSYLADNLPDSTWSFVDREIIDGAIDTVAANADFTLYDHLGDDVTTEVLDGEGELLILAIPEIDEADVSFTFYINSLGRYISSRGGRLVAVIAGDDEDVARWQDISLAIYPVYTAASTSIKEFARGTVALVYVNDGAVVWKRRSTSFDGEEMLARLDNGETLADFHIDGAGVFRLLSLTYAVCMVIVIFFDGTRRLISKILRKKRKKKVTLQPEKQAD